MLFDRWSYYGCLLKSPKSKTCWRSPRLIQLDQQSREHVRGGCLSFPNRLQNGEVHPTWLGARARCWQLVWMMHANSTTGELTRNQFLWHSPILVWNGRTFFPAFFSNRRRAVSHYVSTSRGFPLNQTAWRWPNLFVQEDKLFLSIHYCCYGFRC